MLWKQGVVVQDRHGRGHLWGRWCLDGICPGPVPLGQHMLLQDVACFHGEPLGVGRVGVGQYRPDLRGHGIEKDGPFPCLRVATGQAPHVEQELHGLPVSKSPLPDKVYELGMLAGLGPPVTVYEGGVQGLVPAPHRLWPGEYVLHLLQCLAGEGM